jgi:uncharacterized membrane protein
MEAERVIEFVGQLVDIFGVAVIIVGTVLASLNYAAGVLRRENTAYRLYRKNLGKTLLLGLELLVAADIIRTVAIEPTLESVAVLAIIVVIRTFLSWSLEVEINGHWPWQKGSQTNDPV